MGVPYRQSQGASSSATRARITPRSVACLVTIACTAAISSRHSRTDLPRALADLVLCKAVRQERHQGKPCTCASSF